MLLWGEKGVLFVSRTDARLLNTAKKTLSLTQRASKVECHPTQPPVPATRLLQNETLPRTKDFKTKEISAIQPDVYSAWEGYFLKQRTRLLQADDQWHQFCWV
ncbi:uncharacterized protein ACIB01_011964 isoform 2-T2 [Guaruba guarouba]